jgi:maltose/moltooligosaccharide transporter
MTTLTGERPFNYKKTIIVGFGFLGISIIWPIFNQYIPIFLQAGNPAFEGGTDVRGFGLGPALALFIMTWDNLINVFVQPWVGAKSDQTWNRFGRRKPWILLGVPVALVGFTLIPFAQTAVAIAAFILITNFGMALFRSPTVAWLGDLYEPDDRSKANGIINMMGGVGGLLAFFGGGYLFEHFSAIDPELGRMAPFIGGGILLLAAALVALLGVREPQKISTEAEPENPGVLANLRTVWHNPDRSGLFVLLGILLWFMAFNALEAGLSSFAVFTLDISPGTASIYAGAITISLILFAVPAGIWGTKYGRRQIIRIGLTGSDDSPGRGLLCGSGGGHLHRCAGAGRAVLGLRQRQQPAAGLRPRRRAAHRCVHRAVLLFVAVSGRFGANPRRHRRRQPGQQLPLALPLQRPVHGLRLAGNAAGTGVVKVPCAGWLVKREA